MTKSQDSLIFSMEEKRYRQPHRNDTNRIIRDYGINLIRGSGIGNIIYDNEGSLYCRSDRLSPGCSSRFHRERISSEELLEEE